MSSPSKHLPMVQNNTFVRIELSTANRKEVDVLRG
jgi:hypothetical protein